MFKLKKSIAISLASLMLLLGSCSSSDVSTTPKEEVNTPVKIEQEVTKEESTTEEFAEKDTTLNESSVTTENNENNNVLNNNIKSEAKLHFIDTGNSDAILIEQSGKFALIDGGDTDDNKVVSYLKNQGVGTLEYVFATHLHADHIGGLDSVIANFNINKVLVSNGSATSKTYREFINSMANKGISPSVPLLGSEFELGTSKFKVLSVANTDDPNNNSIVLEYQNGNDKVLLMGDAEAQIEANLNVGKVDILKVGHHGSHSSSTKSFISKVSPKYAVIQVGANNKYGHPHKETVTTLQENGIVVHRNDECGTIVFKSSGNGVSTDCKEGSYNSPNNGNSSSNDNKKESSQNIGNATPIPTPQDKDTNNEVGKVVYWTKSGKKYHLDPNCSNMNNPQSGTIEESGRDACKKCA